MDLTTVIALALAITWATGMMLVILSLRNGH